MDYGKILTIALWFVICCMLVKAVSETLIHGSMDDLLEYKGVERRKQPR